MSGISIAKGELIPSVAEFVGIKAGLALTLKELTDRVPERHLESWRTSRRQGVHFDSVEFEDLIQSVLHSLGTVSLPFRIPPWLFLTKKYPEQLGAIGGIVEKFAEWTATWVSEPPPQHGHDPTGFLNDIEAQYGSGAAIIAGEFLILTNEYVFCSPWKWQCDRVRWKEPIELKKLFVTRSLEIDPASFFDQRYIDYLERNGDDLERMHWRKFEALTCEFFARLGYEVAIGPGIGDDGVDARIWTSAEAKAGPPLILVQCKRQKKKNPVGKVTVKALWADVHHEGATSGLIVTTSSLEPGARAMCSARGYPIKEADHQNVRKWLMAMRTPGVGLIE